MIVLRVTYVFSLLLLASAAWASNYGAGEADAREMMQMAAPMDPNVLSGYLPATSEISADDAVSQGQADASDPTHIVNAYHLGDNHADDSAVFSAGVAGDISDYDCTDGNCGDQSYTPSDKFGTNAAKFLGLMESAKGYTQTEQPVSVACHPSRHRKCPTYTITQLLKGHHYRCHEAGFGYNNCCSEHGWGQDLGLAGCNSEEKQLGEFRAKKWCVYAGNYCENSVAGRCVQHKQSWCCYDSLLARVIQQQGHVQLNWSYGDPKHPSCQGFSLEGFQKLDFDRMSFIEVENDIKSHTKTLSGDATVQRVRQQMTQTIEGGT